MEYPIDEKLVIGVASSALFDLSESDKVFKEGGEDKYRKYQRENIDNTLEKGVAFPFIKRFLSLNNVFEDERPVEVVLLSKNDPDTGLRVFQSINKHNLNISRAAFVTGNSPYEFIPAFNVSLFLSANKKDVEQAIKAGYPAGFVMQSKINDDDHDTKLKIAFDFDGVIADDESEKVYKKSDLTGFMAYEKENVHIPHKEGPLGGLFKRLSSLQELERNRKCGNNSYQRVIRISIVTARAAPAHERVVTTLNQWGVSADDTFFLGGMKKNRVLEILKPHIFFDDQLSHLKVSDRGIPMVHIPFGIANHASDKAP
ncbi:MAG: 5'-nucleotidase [Candidatus Endonucleobacter bathymodioli]|uniref:5'-nucleotidase n=1 Tax=Candidatus Endonucleibacter bathymodioli TaxID=539814 RepID=A0AA90NM70_9GAMM|nr:5'-nucleotidase [Candidatus Endonucleobacter bathymodioli]